MSGLNGNVFLSESEEDENKSDEEKRLCAGTFFFSLSNTYTRTYKKKLPSDKHSVIPL